MPSVSELCKTGELKQAYQQAAADYQMRPDSTFTQADISMVMLVYLRQAVAGSEAGTAARCISKLAALSLPANAGREEPIFWEIRKLLAALAVRQPVPGLAITGVLQAMLDWPVAQVPTLGRSVMLQAALKVKDFLPDGWLAWWNLALLRPADFVQDPMTDQATGKIRKLPSIAERAYGAWASSLAEQLQKSRTGDANYQAIARPNVGRWRQEAEFLLPQLQEMAAAYPEYQWLPYQRAKLLVALGDDLPGALNALLPVVRQKSTEYWAWQLLGEVLRPTNAAGALACYYKAANCRTEEHFLGKVRETLAFLLREAGHPAEAAQQLRQLVAHKEAEGLNVSFTLKQQLNQSWYTTAGQPDKKQHFRWLEQADELLYGNLPWEAAVLLDIREATEDKPAIARLLINAEAAPLNAPLKRYPWLKKHAPGHPLQLRQQEGANGRPRVMQLEPRPAGQAWDVYPAQCGVITYLNPAKGTAGFIVSPTLQGHLNLSSCSLPDLRPGDAVQLRLRQRTNREGQARLDVLGVEVTTQTPSASVFRIISGQFRLMEAGFGFVDTAFVPPVLVREQGWQNGETLQIKTVWSHDSKKNKAGWVAVAAGAALVQAVS